MVSFKLRSVTFPNAQAIFSNGFLGQARGDSGSGDIFFGFNLIRAFSL
ncbi:DUF5777 family beta-barrel protein [uncultured Winogradskyella sp.]